MFSGHPSLQSTFLSEPKTWTVFTDPLYPGFYLVKRAFSDIGIRELLGRVVLQYITGRCYEEDNTLGIGKSIIADLDRDLNKHSEVDPDEIDREFQVRFLLITNLTVLIGEQF